MEKLVVQKFGKEFGVILPESIWKKLNVKDGDSLFALDDTDGFKLTPFDPNFDEAMIAAKEGMRKYRNTLRELGK